jgi:hypothetical protein
MTMCENFKRIEKLIVEKDLEYIPDNWVGKNDAVVQEELLDHILMYVLKLAFDELILESDEKLISESEWSVIADKKIDEYAFWYAEDILDDLSILYKFENLLGQLDSKDYQKCEKIKIVYDLYAKSLECEPSAFYEKIYEFVDEELKDIVLDDEEN